MSKALSLALLIAGIVLIIWGVNASESFSSDVSKFFTGAPTDKSIWLSLGGIVASTVGLFGLTFGGK
jgi:hypothetical protein